MKNDKNLEQILAALQASQPALKEEAVVKLTSFILIGIENRKQLTNTTGRLLGIARKAMAAAAVFLIAMFLYQSMDAPTGNHQSGIIYNKYYKETIRNHDSLPKTNSIKVAVDHYRQSKKGKSDLTLLKEQFSSMAKK